MLHAEFGENGLNPSREKFVRNTGVHKVSEQFQKFVTVTNDETDKRKLLQNETYIFKFFLFFFFFLPHFIHFYMG